MIRIARSVLTLSALALALTATAQASTITVAYNAGASSGSNFVYTINFDQTGPDISLSSDLGESIILSGFGSGFTGNAPLALNGDILDFFTVAFDGSLDGGSFVLAPLTSVATSGDSRSFDLTVSAPGFVATATTGSFSATFSLDEEPGYDNSAPGLLVPVLGQSLDPVAAPEPSTLALGLIGLAGLAVARRRMK